MTKGGARPKTLDMFTGLITAVGTIADIAQGRDARAFTVESAYAPQTIAMGASIAHAGVCLTVVDHGAREGGGAWHRVEVSAETLSKTTLGAWAVGDGVNLEQALKLGDELGGHMVSGHVDTPGVVMDRAEVDGSLRFVIGHSLDFARYVATKGSVCVDGVSLTVNDARVMQFMPNALQVDRGDLPADEASFDVNIIPHTAQVTTLGRLQVGDRVNLEADMIARHIAHLDGLERAARRACAAETPA